MIYSYKKVDKGYYVFQDKDPEPFDGPMSELEAIILTQNCNETEDPSENDSNPIIKEIVFKTKRIKHLLETPFAPISY